MTSKQTIEDDDAIEDAAYDHLIALSNGGGSIHHGSLGGYGGGGTTYGAGSTTYGAGFNTSYNVSTYPSIYPTTIAGDAITVTGDATITGNLTIGGVKLSDRLNKIEERLAILRPSPELESKWEDLKKLGEQYRALEKEIIEKENMWDVLKK